MDRTSIAVVGTVVAALGLFGLKLWSDDTPTPDVVWTNSRAGAPGFGPGQGEAGDGSEGSLGGARRHLEGGSGRLGGRRVAGLGRGEAGRTGRRDRTGWKRGGASVVGSSGGRKAGVVGTSGGSHRGAGLGSSASIADVPGKRKSLKRSREIADFLSTQEPTRPDYAAEPGADPEEDVVLEINTAEDSDQAIDLRNVEESSDGVGLDLKEDSVLAFPNAGNAKGDAGSISFEVDPEWVGSDQTDNSFVQIRTPHGWDNRMQLVKNGRYLRFILTDNTSRESDISLPIDHWEPGDPHSITATWGEGRTQLYVDGQRVGQNTYEGRFEIPPSTPMYVGSDLPGGTYAGASATIQNFKVYGRALAEEEVPLP